jgi:propionyl-CoA carboxylase alpha chain
VANRGEIARRVFRSCRDLGIGTVAVHSDADAALPFVREADHAVRLPGSTPAETYLRADLLVEAARRAGADAVHPGYGFLSENPDFARAVTAAGLTWVGPTAGSMEQMATKVEAKRLMAAAGVPVLSELDPAAVTEADLPVLVKASAGGGGRGMRVVRSLDALAATVEQASAEAASAFGDPTVFVEPYVECGRHVEVQVVGDVHGAVAVLGERDCSLQRRHQKVVEETPAPGISEGLRTALFDAARAVATTIGYVGAGTVEFLVSTGPGGDRFFFLEMNTRLQVEHPVTEAVTGVDLVALQIAVAEGRPLDERLLAAGGAPTRGAAVEVRLYAEDPAAGWRPQSGTLTAFEVPGVTARFENPAGHGLRLDAGFEAGDAVGTHYDAMLAKVVSFAPTREEAFRRLVGCLSRARIHGVRTNRDLLVGLLRDPGVLAGRVSTDLLDGADVSALAGSTLPVEQAALAAAVALAERARAGRPVQPRIPAGWRNVQAAPHTTRFLHGGEEVVARWRGGREGFSSADLDVRVVQAGPARVVLEEGGVTTAYDVVVSGDRVDVDSPRGHVALTRRPRFVDPADQVAEGSLLAPMPGAVVAVHGAAGDAVRQGRPVLVMEAMKMQHTIVAPVDGVLAEVAVTVGDQVAAGDVLAVVHAVEDQSGAAS